MKQSIRVLIVALMTAISLVLAANAASAGDPSQWGASVGDPSQWAAWAGAGRVVLR
ncbi:hypothetical protein ABZ783_23425 [Micromonospora sp. NPDC047738]|uniref:hypothetical protein n=1 Tax=Micromonospora sp. NPDC047738 TaxID=3155741 RepID=UPI0033D6FB9F